jgi:signal transduction histidine kinase
MIERPKNDGRQASLYVHRDSSLDRAIDNFIRYLGVAAHKINNPSCAINTNIHYIKDRIKEIVRGKNADIADVEEAIDDSFQAVQRVVSMNKRAAGFALNTEFEVVNIDNLVQSVIAQIPPAKKNKIFMEGGNTYGCNVDVMKLSLALEEVVKNACESIIDGGTIKIKTDVVNIGGIFYSYIEIEDDGSGINESDFDNIFYPGASNANYDNEGLGLSIVYHIVNRLHNGFIGIDSKTGDQSFTKIKLYLPQKIV